MHLIPFNALWELTAGKLASTKLSGLRRLTKCIHSWLKSTHTTRTSCHSSGRHPSGRKGSTLEYLHLLLLLLLRRGLSH